MALWPIRFHTSATWLQRQHQDMQVNNLLRYVSALSRGKQEVATVLCDSVMSSIAWVCAVQMQLHAIH